MKKIYEHDLVTVSSGKGEEVQKTLTDYGLDGWALVAVTDVELVDGVRAVRLYFRREKMIEEEESKEKQP